MFALGDKKVFLVIYEKDGTLSIKIYSWEYEQNKVEQNSLISLAK